jgi:predicted ATP-dependent protease
VAIPAANVRDLMLNDEVVEAVRDGQFHVYAVETIDEGLELLTGKTAGELAADGSYPPGSIHHAVQDHLRALAVGLQQFEKAESQN